MTVANQSEFQQRMSRVESLVDQIESHPDPTARDLARRLTRALLDLHEVGFRRMLELLDEGDDSEDVPAAWQKDPLVSNLLILHQLHPLDVQSRIEKAIAELTPTLARNHVQLEIVELSDDRVRLQLSGGCGGCPSSQAAMARAVDDAICAAAPELQVTISETSSAVTAVSMLPVLDGGSRQP